MLIREMQCIITILEEGSLVKAADVLFLTPPALSRMVSRIEQRLGVALFNKTKVPWELTYAGQAFVKTAIEISSLNDKLNTEIQTILGDNGNLTIAIMYFEEKYLLPKILPDFHTRYPNFQVNLSHSTIYTLETLLLSKKVDFALITLPNKNIDIEYIPIKTYEILLALPIEHILAQNYSYPLDNKSFAEIDLALLKDYPFIMPRYDCIMNETTFDICRSFGFVPKISLETHTLDSAFSFVSDSYGATFIFDQIITTQTTTLNAYFKIKDHSLTKTIALAYKKGRQFSIIEQDFLQALKDYS